MTVRVGIVLVSHSAKLAEGLKELAAQMAPDVPIAAAGGTASGGLGTSFDRVEAAIANVRSDLPNAEGGGVLLLSDLGSATMTIESAIDMSDTPEGLVFTDAPLVEGATAAAVRAQIGDGIGAVAQAAQNAGRTLASEAAQQPDGSDTSEALMRGPEDVVRATAVVADPTGLHARPAALVARAAGSFNAEVLLNDVDAGSVLELMALGVAQGEAVNLEASGPQAQEAIAELVAIIEKRR